MNLEGGYMHPVDASTIKYRKLDNRVYGLGMNQHEGKVFYHLENLGSMEEASRVVPLIPKAYGADPEDIVLGAAIDEVETTLQEKAMFNITSIGSVGVWILEDEVPDLVRRDLYGEK